MRNTTSPKKIAKITILSPNPGDCVWPDEGTTVTAVVGVSEGKGLDTGVMTTVWVVSLEVAIIGVFVICVTIVVALVISGF